MHCVQHDDIRINSINRACLSSTSHCRSLSICRCRGRPAAATGAILGYG
jgi:ribosomal protein S14